MILPPPLNTGEKGSFAEYSLFQRFPAIVKAVIDQNTWPEPIRKKLNLFWQTIPDGALQPLAGTDPTAVSINQKIKQNQPTWVGAPFLWVENYLYRKLRELTDFKHNQRDYFLPQKEKQIRQSLAVMRRIADRFTHTQSGAPVGQLNELLHLNLLGNKADLSQTGSYYRKDKDSVSLLIDDSLKAVSLAKKARRVDIILDNAGLELFLDLLLALNLLALPEKPLVCLHFKDMPYFVSDANISDYKNLLAFLGGRKELKGFACAINAAQKNDKLRLSAHPFWSSGNEFKRMPADLKAELSGSELLVFKGDLNYRKLIGDYKWPPTTNTAGLVDYLPAACLIIRVLKSELIVGLPKKFRPSVKSNSWLYSGEYGILEIVEP